MNKSRRKVFGFLAIALVALFALACVVGFAACGDDDGDGNNDKKADATVSSVSLSGSTLSLTAGGSATLTATVTMSDSSSYTGSYEWESDATGVATVSSSTTSSVTVSAIAAGTANVTVTAGGKSATCVVTVKAAASAPEEGVYRFEAENAKLNADEETFYEELEDNTIGSFITPFIFNVQEDDTASEGKVVGYLSECNPTITFEITSSVATTATLTLGGASCYLSEKDLNNWEGLAASSILEYSGSAHTGLLTVNNASVTMTGSLPGANSVFTLPDFGLNTSNWGTMTAEINLVEGLNTIVLTFDDAGLGVDYIDIETTAELSFTAIDNSNFDNGSY